MESCPIPSARRAARPDRTAATTVPRPEGDQSGPRRAPSSAIRRPNGPLAPVARRGCAVARTSIPERALRAAARMRAVPPWCRPHRRTGVAISAVRRARHRVAASPSLRGTSLSLRSGTEPARLAGRCVMCPGRAQPATAVMRKLTAPHKRLVKKPRDARYVHRKSGDVVRHRARQPVYDRGTATPMSMLLRCGLPGGLWEQGWVVDPPQAATASELLPTEPCSYGPPAQAPTASSLSWLAARR